MIKPSIVVPVIMPHKIAVYGCDTVLLGHNVREAALFGLVTQVVIILVVIVDYVLAGPFVFSQLLTVVHAP